MISDVFKLVLQIAGAIFAFAPQLIAEQIRARIQSRRYEATNTPRNIVVVGGSWAGVEVVKQLVNSVPTGWRVVLVEKNSHFNYTFAFPRFSVIPGYESQAFVPYNFLERRAPTGSFLHVRGTAKKITAKGVVLDSGETVEYGYLVIATGTSSPRPSKFTSTEWDDACLELRTIQDEIKAAQNIAIIGGGAVGVQLVSDIKTFYPDKQATLYQSRQYLLPQFGKRLQDYALEALEKVGVSVVLGERPKILVGEGDAKQNAIQLSDGTVESYDLIIPCTGQRPNSAILAEYYPAAICPKTGEILVTPTLQVAGGENSRSNLFAVGDVAATGGAKMARAAFFQSRTVSQNICALIRGQEPCKIYKPRRDIEGAIKLSLGMSNLALYSWSDSGTEIMLTGLKLKKDLDIGKGWAMLGADRKLLEQLQAVSKA